MLIHGVISPFWFILHPVMTSLKLSLQFSVGVCPHSYLLLATAGWSAGTAAFIIRAHQQVDPVAELISAMCYSLSAFNRQYRTTWQGGVWAVACFLGGLSVAQVRSDWGLCANFLSGSGCLRPGGRNRRTRINTEIAELFLSNLSSSRSDLPLLELREITDGRSCRIKLLYLYQAVVLTETPTKSRNKFRHKIKPR